MDTHYIGLHCFAYLLLSGIYLARIMKVVTYFYRERHRIFVRLQCVSKLVGPLAGKKEYLLNSLLLFPYFVLTLFLRTFPNYCELQCCAIACIVVCRDD